MAFSFPKASIVVPTYNNRKTLAKTLKAMQQLSYQNEFEVIVVDDGSTDSTAELVQNSFGKDKRIKLIRLAQNSGVCRARNTGINAALFPIVVNMDNDCIPAKNWLSSLVKGFQDKKIGTVSSFGAFGGTSTAFRKKLLDKVGGYDEDYFFHREDTDLTFKIMGLGYGYKAVKAGYFHDHREVRPKGLVAITKYVWKRLCYHENDVLLFKKHPRLAAEFLDVKLGFLINPAADFRVAANLWEGSSKNMKLCSPRGFILIENKTPLHAAAIVSLAVLYAFAVKLFRLYGSLRFGKLLI